MFTTASTKYKFVTKINVKIYEMDMQFYNNSLSKAYFIFMLLKCNIMIPKISMIQI